MKSVFSLVVIFATLCDQAVAASVLQLDVINQGIEHLDPRSMSQETRLAYVEAVKRGSPGFKHFLVRLHDDETMVALVSEWEAAAGASRTLRTSLESCASPWLVPALAKFLYSDEAPKERRHIGDEHKSIDYGFAHATAVVISKNLLAAPEVPEPVKVWARGFRKDETAFLDLLPQMRRWWERNRENMVKERYDLLVPPSVDPQRSNSTSVRDTPTSAGPQRSEQVTSQNDRPPEIPGGPAAAVLAPNDKPTVRLGWWVAGVVVSALMFLFVLRIKAKADQTKGGKP